MSTVTDHKNCKQCGYELGVFELDCHTCEWEFDCLRCGYRESQEWVTAEEKSRIGWKHEILDGHGAVWATGPGVGVSTFCGLRSTQAVEEAVQKMQTAIANGDLDARSSYVTRWNSKLKRPELVAGTWCQDGEVFDDELFEMARFPVDVLKPEKE